MYLTTTSGKQFEIAWIGVAKIDSALRASIINADSAEVFSTFTNQKETKAITSVLDGVTNTYVNYTVFKSIDIEPDGSIIVALGRK